MNAPFAARGLFAAAVAMPFFATLVMAVEPIGTPEWTSQEAVGQPPEAERRALSPGLPVVFREAVTTDARGAADFIFNNSARLLVGPECEITLDERFYDPELDVDVVRAGITTDTFCVSRVDQVLALRISGAPSDDVSPRSVDARPPEPRTSGVPSADVSPQLSAAFAGGMHAGLPVIQIDSGSTQIIVAGGAALIGIAPASSMVRVVKTSSEGIIIVRTPNELVVIRRDGFDVQVTNVNISGPVQTGATTIQALHARLMKGDVDAAPPQLPYMLEQPIARPVIPFMRRDRFGTGRPDHCIVTDSCFGIERTVAVEIEFDDFTDDDTVQ